MSVLGNVLVFSKDGNYTVDTCEYYELKEEHGKYWYIAKPVDRYVSICELVYQDDEIRAYEISDKEALDAILESNKFYFLEKTEFTDLKDLYNKTITKEENSIVSFDDDIVPVYDGKLFAVVKINHNFDSIENRGNTHWGVTKLTDGQYVLIKSIDYQEACNIAYVATKNEVLYEIIKNESLYILKQSRFKELKDLYISKQTR